MEVSDFLCYLKHIAWFMKWKVLFQFFQYSRVCVCKMYDSVLFMVELAEYFPSGYLVKIR